MLHSDAILSFRTSGPLLSQLPRMSDRRACLQHREAADAVCEFTLISSRAEFDALETDWVDLFDRAGSGANVFQNFHWLWHWCNHFLVEDDKHTLAIVTGRWAGKLVLVWPLVVHQSGGLKRLSWMGQPVSQYGDILIDRDICTEGDLEKSWDFLSQNIPADLVHLRKVRADAAVADLLRAICKTPIVQQSAPYLDLSNSHSFDDYQQRYAGKARKNRRRLRRRVEERATLKVTAHHKGESRSEYASQAVLLKRNWLEARGLLSAAIQDERTRHFFVDAASSERHPTGCRTTALTIDEQTAAIEVSFVSKGHCAVHIIVYGMDYEKAGTGVLLMEDSIKNAIDTGVNTFDLMAPGDSYKLDWADGTINVEDWQAALSARGHAYQHLRINKLPQAAKKTVQALPLSLRQLLHRSFANTRNGCAI